MTQPRPKRTPPPPLVIRDHHPEVPDLEAKRRALAFIGFIKPRPQTPQAAD